MPAQTVAHPSRRLHDVADDYLALEDLLLESGGELTPEVDELMAENKANLAGKADGYAALISEWLSDADRLRAEEERVAARRRARENAAQRLKDRLCEELRRCGQLRVETPRFRLAVQRSAPSVELLVTPELLPAPYQRVVTTVSADKAAIKAALLQGPVCLADGRPVAQFREGTSYLRIR